MNFKCVIERKYQLLGLVEFILTVEHRSTQRKSCLSATLFPSNPSLSGLLQKYSTRGGDPEATECPMFTENSF
jgi:hypothetical protein